MEEERKLSICIAEFPSRAEGRFHTGLLLIEESEKDWHVVQHLHFSDYAEAPNGTPNGVVRMIPYVRDGMSYENLESIKHMMPVIGGYERDILDTWNHMLAHAYDVKEEGYEYDCTNRNSPNALNCRMGVVSALASIGINVEDGYYKNKAGTVDNRIGISFIFPLFATEREDLDVVRDQNTALSELLPRPEQEDTYLLLTAAAQHLSK